jgi:hypothetical protein
MSQLVTACFADFGAYKMLLCLSRGVPKNNFNMKRFINCFKLEYIIIKFNFDLGSKGHKFIVIVKWFCQARAFHIGSAYFSNMIIFFYSKINIILVQKYFYIIK